MSQRASCAMPVGPDLKIDYRDPASLKLNPKNTRRHSAGQIAKIAANMAAFGMIVPVLRDREDNVVCGHARVMAARQIGLKAIPTILLEHLRPEQLRAFALAENRLHELGEWNEVALAEELKSLTTLDLDFSLDLTGFEIGEIDVRVLGPVQAPAINDNMGIEEGPAVTRPGDLWQLGKHRLLCASSLEEGSFVRLLGGK